MLIDVERLATICVILPPAPSVLQEGSSDACVYTRGSVRRTRERLPSNGCIESELLRSRLTGTALPFASDTALT